MERTMRWRAVPTRAGRVYRRNTGGRRIRAAAAAGAMVAVAMPVLSADGAVGGTRSIEVFTSTDMIMLAGYPHNTDVRVEVVRHGFVVGFATKRTDSLGGITMNHVGGLAGDCFDSSSPDVQPGDTIRATVQEPGGTRDTSMVRGVWIEDMQFSDTTITATGRVDVEGPAAVNPAADILELRIDKDTDWVGIGRSDLRSVIGPEDVQPDGVWTHEITGLDPADVVEARNEGETVLELSREAASELTVAEFGPQEPLEGCPRAASGPTRPQLLRAQDSGQAGDHVTNQTTDLTFSGLADMGGDGGANQPVTLQVDGADAAEVTANSNGVYRFTGVNLAARATPHTVRVIAAGGDFASRQVTVDSRSPGVGLRSLAPSPLHVAGGDTLRAVYNIREGATLVARIEHVNPTRIVKAYARRTQAAPGLAEFTWNGKNVAGHDARPGRYALVLQVTDRAGNVTVQRDRFRVVR
jgi:hypothetical protein